MSGRQSLVGIQTRRFDHSEQLLAMVGIGDYTHYHTGQNPYEKGL